jgi:WD40 repeat protein
MQVFSYGKCEVPIMVNKRSRNWQGKMLQQYRILGLLGRGGMGEVWLAEDTLLHRQVAMKLLLPVLASDRHYLQDFAYEARAAAALEHPHILALHDFGEHFISADEMVVYLVMPYVSGGSLRDRMRRMEGPFPVNEGMHYLRQAAQAIDYAHSQQVLHRDIKPANMLLQQDWLLLADFGLAKLLASATYRSRTHAGAGTPEYMAPEQVHGKAEMASDRYSFAMIAYQMFTGRLPFRGDTPFDMLLKQMQELPPPPRQFNPLLPLQVERTLLQGLAKQPEERPVSCMAFVTELERGWNGGAGAQVDLDATELAPWSKRHQQAFAPLAAVQAAHEQIPAGEAPADGAKTAPMPHTASGKARREGPPRKIGRRRLLIGGAALTALAIGGGFSLATLWHRLPPPVVLKKPLPGPRAFMPGVPLLKCTGHSDIIWNVQWDPTGHYLASAGDDTRVMVWKVGDVLQKKQPDLQVLTQPQAQWKFDNKIEENALCWVGEHLLAATPGDNNRFYLMDSPGKAGDYKTYVDSRALVNGSIPAANTFLNVSRDPQTGTLAISELPASHDQVLLWDIKDPLKPRGELNYGEASGRYIGPTAWSPAGSLLVGTDNGEKLTVWDVKSGKEIAKITLPRSIAALSKHVSVVVLRNALVWSPIDQHQVAAANIDVVALCDIRQSEPLLLLGTDDPDLRKTPAAFPNTGPWIGSVFGITWSPNGRYIAASYTRSLKVYVWDLQERAPKTTRDGARLTNYIFGATGGHSGAIVDLQWSPDGHYLATVSYDKTVMVWKVDETS